MAIIVFLAGFSVGVIAAFILEITEDAVDQTRRSKLADKLASRVGDR